MKKMLFLLLTLASFVLFYEGYVSISQMQYNETYNLANLIAEKSQKQLYPVMIELPKNEESRKGVMDDVISFVYSNDEIVIANSSTKNKRKEQVNRFFVYTPDEELPCLILKDDCFIDFSQNTLEYYSTNRYDTNKTNEIAFIDKKYNEPYNGILEIHSFSQYPRLWSGNTLFLLNFITLNVENLTSEIETRLFSEYIVDSGNAGFSIAHTEQIDYSLLGLILFFVYIVIVLCFLCYILSIKKEIEIRKIMGMTDYQVCNKVILDFVIISSLLFASAFCIYYLFFVGNFHKVNIMLIKYLLISMVGFFSILALVYLIVFIAVYHVRRVTELKEDKSVKAFEYMSTTLKYVFLLVMFTPLFSSFSYIFDVGNRMYKIMDNYEIYEKSLKVNGINISSFSEDIIIAETTIKDFFTDKHYIYEDFYAVANVEDSSSSLPFVVVNKNYLENVKLYRDRLLFDIEDIKENTLLIPKAYEKVNPAEYCLASSCDVVEVDSGFSLVSHEPIGDFYRKDPIVFLASNNLENQSVFDLYLLDNDGKILAEFERYLMNHNLFDKVDLGYRNQIADSQLRLYRQLLIESFGLTISTIISLILFQFQTIYLFISQNRKSIVINILVGKNKLLIYRDLIIENIVVYSFLFITTLLLNSGTLINVIFFILLSVAIDILMFVLFTRYFEKRKIISVLKGDRL